MAYKIAEDVCAGCQTCIDECPNEAISFNGTVCEIDPDKCVDCGTCADACPVEAIHPE
jgi:Heterodisulfide reductase, subunit A and related polyferredoxins